MRVWLEEEVIDAGKPLSIEHLRLTAGDRSHLVAMDMDDNATTLIEQYIEDGEHLVEDGKDRKLNLFGPQGWDWVIDILE